LKSLHPRAGAAADVKQPPTDTNGKPVLNEESFQELLSAAYVMQKQLGKEPEAGGARILAEILDTQGQIRGMRLDLRAATVLIARRARELSSASGVAIGILDHDQLEYYAATGTAASEGGWHAAPESTLAAECLRTGAAVQIPDAEKDGRLRPDLCQSLSVRALIAAPAVHAGKVAGVLELHFSQPGSFREHDVRTCQLMATLVSEAITSDAEAQARASARPETRQGTADPASAPAVSRNLAFPIERPAATSAPPPQPVSVAPTDSEPRAEYCSCGVQLGPNDLYCGTCGSARPARDSAGQVTQSTWASLWDMQRKAEESVKLDSRKPQDSSAGALDVYPSELEEIVAKFSTEPFEPGSSRPAEVQLPPFAAELLSEEVPQQDADDEEDPSTSMVDTPRPASSTSAAVNRASLLSFGSSHPERPTPRPPASSRASSADRTLPPFEADTIAEKTQDHAPEREEDSLVASLSQAGPVAADAPWGSAKKTKEWLEAQGPRNGWLAQTWRAQRANIYLAAAALVLVAVLAGWGSPSVPSTNAANTHSTAKARPRKAPPKPELTFAEKLLIDLGLADPPPAPVDMGNPKAQVWVDVHTALYYCQGEDLYGKTPGGKVTTQGDAQQDSFQPAARKPCD
jgi:GAF domain